MELRSQRKGKEFDTLKQDLMELSLYEEGMNLDDMRSIKEAFIQSLLSNEDVNSNTDKNQQELRVSQRDFLEENLLSSTVNSHSMFGEDDALSDVENEHTTNIMVVKADVHHPMDWEPPPPVEDDDMDVSDDLTSDCEGYEDSKATFPHQPNIVNRKRSYVDSDMEEDSGFFII